MTGRPGNLFDLIEVGVTVENEVYEVNCQAVASAKVKCEAHITFFW